MSDDEIEQLAQQHLYRSLRPIGLMEFARAIEARVLADARRTVSGQEAEWWEVTRDGEREVVSADHYHRHDWSGCTARPLFAAPIPATEPKEPK